MPKQIVCAKLEEIGFELLGVAGDGQIEIEAGIGQEPFFPGEKYGEAGVYEVLCRKVR